MRGWCFRYPVIGILAIGLASILYFFAASFRGVIAALYADEYISRTFAVCK